jgi:Tfp pilus assembly protein PilN
MQDLHLDFLRPSAPRIKAGTTLFAIALVCALASAWQFYRLSSAQDLLQTQLSDTRNLLRRGVLKVSTTAVEDPKVKEEIVRANLVLTALSLPWDAMFRELEAAGDKNIALLAIQPETGARHIRLAGEARRFEDLLAYMRRLEATPGFSNVLLTSHALRDDSDEAVRFTLSTDWAEQ